jgi:hypothetical protein
MAELFELHGEIPLTDDELDKVLAAADEELLEYVRAAARPEQAILKIMAFEEGSSAPTGESGSAPTAGFGSEPIGEFGAPRPSARCPGAARRSRNWPVTGTIAACLILIGFCASRPASAIITRYHQHVYRQFREAGMRAPEKEISFTVSFEPHQYGISQEARTKLSVILKVSKIWRQSNVTISAYASRHPGSSETVTLADERIKAVEDWLTARAPAGALHTTTRVMAGRPNAQLHDSLAVVSAVPYAAPRCGRDATGCPP